MTIDVVELYSLSASADWASFDTLADISVDTSINGLTVLRRAAFFERAKEYSSAEYAYSEAIDGGSLGAELLSAAYDGRCVCRLRLGDAAGAAADHAQALALAPSPARHYTTRGRASLRAGDPAVALADLNRALLLDPFDRQAREARGRCYLSLGQFQRALADFGHLLAVGGVGYQVLLLRAQTHLALGSLGAALVDCEVAARQSCGSDRVVFLLRGRALSLIGDLHAALADLTRAIELGIGGLGQLWRGQLYHALGDRSAAHADLLAFVQSYATGAEAALPAIGGQQIGQLLETIDIPSSYPTSLLRTTPVAAM